VQRHGLQDRVHLLGFVTDAELVALYNACTLFCYPSLYEGFGLPVAEAMSCGAPVVTSRVASLPEVGGEAVCYVDEPRDRTELARALQQVLEDQGLRQRLRSAGLAQAATFSWDRAARETLAILRRVVDDPQLDPVAVEVGRDERGIEAGFHDLERDGDGSFRWMQRHGRLRLRIRPDHAALRVTASSPLPEGEATLIATVAGATVGTAALEPRPRTFAFPLPRGMRRDVLAEIGLSSTRVLPPAMKGGDARELAARVFSVALQ
jgi:hypothetical protein